MVIIQRRITGTFTLKDWFQMHCLQINDSRWLAYSIYNTQLNINVNELVTSDYEICTHMWATYLQILNCFWRILTWKWFTHFNIRKKHTTML